MFADTPPARARVSRPRAFAARTDLRVRASQTERWKDAAISAGSGVSPFCSALCSRFTTAVFMPEKLKSISSVL